MGRIAFIILAVLGVAACAAVFLGIGSVQSECQSARMLAASNLERAVESIGSMRENGVPVTAKSLASLLKQCKWESGAVRYEPAVAWNGGDAGGGWVIWATPKVSDVLGYRVLSSWESSELPRYCVRSTEMEVTQTTWWTPLHKRQP